MIDPQLTAFCEGVLITVLLQVFWHTCQDWIAIIQSNRDPQSEPERS